MSRGPPLSLDISNTHIRELDDGFVRLGDTDTPYTLLDGDEKRKRAATIHAERSDSDRMMDEKTNEPITRELDLWKDDPWMYDFPFIDTIPHEEQLDRAKIVADLAFDLEYIVDITHEVDFDNPERRGRFWENPNEIETRADPDDFLGFRKGPALAHELGHAFYSGSGLDCEFHDASVTVFETNQEEAHARKLSIRLHGPFADSPPGFVDEREHPTELFADVFAARVIEPETARRVGPKAVDRIESLLDAIPRRSPFDVV
jgi:hypothetical protein